MEKYGGKRDLFVIYFFNNNIWQRLERATGFKNHFTGKINLIKGENPIVDSLSIVSEWSVVAKCANHGLIYLWDLK